MLIAVVSSASVEPLFPLALSPKLSRTPASLRAVVAAVATSTVVKPSSVRLLEELPASLSCLRFGRVIDQCERRLVILVFVVEHVRTARELLLVPS